VCGPLYKSQDPNCGLNAPFGSNEIPHCLKREDILVKDSLTLKSVKEILDLYVMGYASSSYIIQAKGRLTNGWWFLEAWWW